MEFLRGPGVWREVQKFRENHQIHGAVAGGISDQPTPEGYLILLSCSCGDAFEKWVTPRMARYDLICTTMLCSLN